MILFFAFLFFPFTVLASSTTEVDYWGYTLKAFGSLALVLGLIVFFFYIMKRVNTMGGRFSNSRMKLKNRLYLDNKHYLAIVEIDGKEFLVGVGESISLLKEIKNENSSKD